VGRFSPVLVDPSAQWVREPVNMQNTEFRCGFFRTGFRSSGGRHYSRAMLRDLGVTSLITGGGWRGLCPVIGVIL
jgi:hypothetical protein